VRPGSINGIADCRLSSPESAAGIVGITDRLPWPDSAAGIVDCRLVSGIDDCRLSSAPSGIVDCRLSPGRFCGHHTRKAIIDGIDRRPNLNRKPTAQSHDRWTVRIHSPTIGGRPMRLHPSLLASAAESPSSPVALEQAQPAQTKERTLEFQSNC
jgi:hypothetical protein